MKRLKTSVYSYRLPYSRPQTWSDIREDVADYVLLRLDDDEGHVGVAEATVKPTWSGHTVATMVTVLREIVLPILRDCTPHAVGPTWRRLAQLAEQPQARGMAETALWSLLAHRQGDGQKTLQVEVSCTLTRQPPTAMADEAAHLHAEYGFRRFKLKGGQGMQVDAEGVRAVRHAVPSGFVQVDANSAYGADALAGYASLLKDAGAVLLEDPCAFPLNGFDGYVVRSALPLLVDLAARDEASASCFSAQGASAISVKPGRYGIPQALRIAAVAAAEGARFGLGLFGESDLGSAINLRAGQAWHDPDITLPAELTAHLALRERLLPGLMLPHHGWLTVPPIHTLLSRIDFERMQSHAH